MLYIKIGLFAQIKLLDKFKKLINTEIKGLFYGLVISIKDLLFDIWLRVTFQIVTLHDKI